MIRRRAFIASRWLGDDGVMVGATRTACTCERRDGLLVAWLVQSCKAVKHTCGAEQQHRACPAQPNQPPPNPAAPAQPGRPGGWRRCAGVLHGQAAGCWSRPWVRMSVWGSEGSTEGFGRAASAPARGCGNRRSAPGWGVTRQWQQPRRAPNSTHVRASRLVATYLAPRLCSCAVSAIQRSLQEECQG